MQYTTYIPGVLAAALTSLSYLPQVKAIPRGSTSDLSLKMPVVLSTGLCLWVFYGLLKEDWVIMLASMVCAALALIVLGLKNSILSYDRAERPIGWLQPQTPLKPDWRSTGSFYVLSFPR